MSGRQWEARKVRMFCSMVALATGLTGLAAAQAPVPSMIPFPLALEAAQAAVAACAARGWPVIVVVLDAYGEDQVLLRTDPHYEVNHTEQARRKAYTALLGDPSAEMLNLMERDPNAYARQAYINPRITPQAGGLPIKIGGATVAAIGVTGAGAANGVRGGTNDESCAAAGVAKIQDRLR
jgi:uncharacterized protein GlcG (DUF336 family)